ncbi:MAG: DnaJ domain-containing protein [Spirochaetales bacterium]|nr:DnaJ domain-containing protein [Spirochaetales bacterium]
MNTYYHILGVPSDASQQEIKDAYRRRVKAVHPDLNNGDPQSVERMKALVIAWEILRDPTRREDYDRIHGIRKDGAHEFDYAEFLRSRRDDQESQSKLVFYDLLHDNPDEALQIYDSLVATGDFELSAYLGREDFMDCAFLLAEEYESRKEYGRAFQLLSAIVRFERQRPYFRHFMQDVYEHLRTVVCFKMPDVAPPEEVLSCLNQMIGWDLPRKETAFCYKKAAEMHLQQGDRRAAFRSLQRGLTLDQHLAGVKKLQQELGYFETA